MAERTITQRELNRALLARQLLLQRARLSLPRALERMGGLQAQYAPSMYIGLWTRVEGFERDALTRALERRTVVQGTLLRSTIHLVSPGDYWPFAVAVEEGRRAWWLRTRRGALTGRQMSAAARRLRRALADGPLRRAQIDELVGKEIAQGVGLWVHMVRVPRRLRPRVALRRGRRRLCAARAPRERVRPPASGPGGAAEPRDRPDFARPQRY